MESEEWTWEGGTLLLLPDSLTDPGKFKDTNRYNRAQKTDAGLAAMDVYVMSVLHTA